MHHAWSITSNRPVDDWGRLLGDTAAVSALLDRLLHRSTVVRCGPRSYRTPGTGSEQAPDPGVGTGGAGVKGKRAERVQSDP